EAGKEIECGCRVGHVDETGLKSRVPFGHRQRIGIGAELAPHVAADLGRLRARLQPLEVVWTEVGLLADDIGNAHFAPANEYHAFLEEQVRSDLGEVLVSYAVL